MSISQELLQKLLQVDGQYGRQVLEAHAIAGGIEVLLATIPFRNVGDELRPIILSDESLEQQITRTGVPNRPPDLHLGGNEPTSTLRLRIQIVGDGTIRIRLGAILAPTRDFGILLADALVPDNNLPIAELQESPEAILVTIARITLRLQKNPFTLQISSTTDEDDEAVTLRTADEDRDVHGLLCTPPPGLLSSQEVYWTWALEPDEHLYGLGERFGSFDQRGHNLRLWTTDAWGTTTAAAYKNVPFLISSQHYGLFFHTSAPVTMQLGTVSARAASVQVGEPELDLFVFTGVTPQAILRQYTQLTGRATVPPRWAFGIWLSRCRYQNREEVEAIAARTRAEQVPCDVLHIDPAWLEHPNLSCDFVASEAQFPDLAGMVSALKEQDFKISLWELPYISANSRRYQEAVEGGYLLLDEQGEPIGADLGTPPADGYTRALIDFTNPAARRWWQDLHRPWLQAGVEVFKTDFGEAVPVQARAWNGMTGHELHNLYPLLYQGTVHEVITQETGRPGMIWGRSGWAGIQRYPAQWGGDPKTDVWSMRSSLRGGLSFALSAPGLWSHDIGGFYGIQPSPELYIRWTQFGMLSPLARAHGTTPREPWEFGEEALANFKRYAALRIRLNPYLYNTAWTMHEQSLPMLRPLLLEFPHDPGTALIDDAYMLGSSLLIAPIFSESRQAVKRTIYLPQGHWYDFWTDELLEGGCYLQRAVPLETLPIYIKAGSILPLGPDRQAIGDSIPEHITLEIYLDNETKQASATRVIWDQHGNGTDIALSYRDDHWQLSIAGQRNITWTVRWHTGAHIVESQLGTHATASAELQA